MKRFFISGAISFFLLTGCTDENSKKENLVPPSPSIEIVQNKSTTQTEQDKVRTNAEEAMEFLQKAVEKTSNLETVSFSSFVYKTAYLNNLLEPELSSFYEYNDTYEGMMQRSPKYATLTTSISQTSGSLVYGEIGEYDDSTSIYSTSTEYFDPELGWYSVSGDYSYGGVPVMEEEPYISHNDLDESFKTLEHIDAFMELFMSYPEQLSLYKETVGDIGGEFELDNWIVELQLTQEQYREHLNMLDMNLFTGSYFESELNELYFVETEDLRDLYLALTFDTAYNLVQLTVFHTYNGLEDYVEPEMRRNDYFINRYFVYFSDYNVPYAQRIPEEVILNADYQR
ncbi:hypothetical protein [Lysinibacillus endophyticus]|uniref:hypothetical protein n=1 Tax=Ureibacillus endophyticus TaxID=1978490 RepID=UPI00209E4A68|nr:hypothetical protein [Lysinibacillus endophyticus]MCP1144811.1 hypothetical protein [Lysinibacillus endophyticus]